MAIAQGDGSIVLTTKVDTSGMKKSTNELRSEAMKLAAQYRKAGMSQSEAQKKAYEELGITTKKTEKATKKTKEYGEQAKKSGAMAKSAFAAVGKAVAAIAVASAAVVVAITKQSVDAFAEYEQLVGGVETLFKGSSKKLIEYANQAYKTAGLSANQYMATVTGFSASLLQSLGGDTEKAADYANRAIIDMSDNANKMGTSMEMIQNAYQGFAKQNYTMLDNLKLGYGGTKTEMERLIKDASQLTEIQQELGVTVDANDTSFGNIVNAISVMQSKMGIAGATFEEAEKTISGSAATMKAAWQNVLTAISGGGDLDRAIKNLSDSISTYFENIVPVVERALEGIAEVIEKIGPQLVQTVAKSIIKAIPRLLNAVVKMVFGLVEGISQGLEQLFSGTTNNVLEEQAENIEKITENQKELTDEVKETEKELEKTLAGFDDIQILSSSAAEDTFLPQIIGDIDLPDISEKSGEMREEISQNIFGAFEDVIERLPELIGKIVSMLPTLTKEIVSALPSLIQTILTSIVSLIPSVASGLTNAVVILLQSLPSIILPILVALPSIISTLLQTVVDNLPLVLDAVGDLISGLILALPEIIQALIVELPNIISLVLQTILMAKPQLINLVFDIVFALAQALPEILSSLIIAIPGALNGVWDAIVNFWKDYIAPIFTAEWWKNLGKTCINGLIAGFEGGINGIIWAFESMINWIVDGLNKISFSMPDWNWLPNAVQGKSFGINIPKATLGRISIPRLAKGTVVPPNKEFMAVLGDNTKEHEIVSPVSTMKQAFMEAMIEMGGNFGGGNTEVVLEIDGREFGRAVVEQGNRENRRIGTRLVVV